MAEKPLGVCEVRTMWRQVGALAATGQLRIAGTPSKRIAAFAFARLSSAARAMLAAVPEEIEFQSSVEAFENEGGPVRPDGSEQPAHSHLVAKGLHLMVLRGYVRR